MSASASRVWREARKSYFVQLGARQIRLDPDEALLEGAYTVPSARGQGVMLQFVNIKAWLLALTLVAGWIAGQLDG